MGRFDYTFKNIADIMDCDSNENSTGLTRDSTDMEILDYLVVQLCKCMDTSSIIFRGGYVLNKIIDKDTPRATVDVDISIEEAGYYESIKSILRHTGEMLVDDKVIDYYRIKDLTSVECSGGIDLYFANERHKLGADIGLRNPDSGTVNMKINGYEIRRFSIERMLADKLSAIYSNVRFRRTKDLYDFYIITNCFDVDLPVMNEYVENDVGIDWSNTPLDENICSAYERAYSKLVVRDPYANNWIATKPSFNVVIERVSIFVCNIKSCLKWKCGERRFIKC